MRVTSITLKLKVLRSGQASDTEVMYVPLINRTARHSLPRPPPNNLYPDPGHFDDDDDVLADKFLLPIN